MHDSSLLNLVLTFISGSGLVALIVGIYEQRVASKERAKQWFRELVLTRDFFNFESLLWDICNLYSEHDRVKKGERRLVIIEGSWVPIPSIDDWRNKMNSLLFKTPEVYKKLEETGVRFCAPKKMRTKMTEVSLAIKDFEAKIKANQDVSDVAKRVENLLRELSRDVRDIMGIRKL